MSNPFRTLWPDPDDPGTVHVIDQRELPHALVSCALRNYRDGIAAISEMKVRGAPLIGATAA
ncbi:MAG: S-methyl-5-thioribose-1-phosphate isomerase, partial [Gammaproteobacteria bacterium]|nr:S-methyl-5-thioribose-1-phosphate isomerase [Gammaproteobacteria bacterium]